MNITCIHKPRSQSTIVKVIKYKIDKKTPTLNEIFYYYTKKVFIGEFTWGTTNSKKMLFSPLVMKYTFYETRCSSYFLLFKDLFLSWKFQELFFFIQLPFLIKTKQNTNTNKQTQKPPEFTSMYGRHHFWIVEN